MLNETNLTTMFQEFWPSNWNKKDDRERIESCQKLENYLSAEGGREPYKVKNYDRATQFFQGLSDLYWLGRTNPSEKTIEVNVKGTTSSFDVLRSLTNESAHADQHELIEKNRKAADDYRIRSRYNQILQEKELSDTDILVMEWEHKNSLNPRNGVYYDQQYIELDARQRSLKFLIQNYTRMGKERDQYKNPQTGQNVHTNFKDYLDVKGECELRGGKALVNGDRDHGLRREDELADVVGYHEVIKAEAHENSKEEQERWLEHKISRGMLTSNNEEQGKLCEVFLNDRCSMSDFKIFNRLKNWEAQKRVYLEEAEKINETKVEKVKLEELEGKQEKTKIRRAYETTTTTLAKTKNCTIL